MSPSSKIAPLARGGFTLIEVLVAIIILMVGMLGLFQAINLALDKTLENQLRQKGIAVAEQQMNDVKARPFNNITGSSLSFSRVASGGIFKNISVQRQVADLAASNPLSKQISVRVWWRYRGRLYEHQTASGVGNNEVSLGN